MEQIMTGISAQKSPFHSRAAAATVADIMRPPLTTVKQHDHVAAAAYLISTRARQLLWLTSARPGRNGISRASRLTGSPGDQPPSAGWRLID
jgi:hypothetical protein